MPGAQKNPFLKPMIAYPMAAIGLLLAVFLIYYFPITSRQEAILNERAFRSLSGVSDSLRNRVASYTSAFEQAAKRGNRKSATDQPPPDRDKDIASYLAQQTPDLIAAKYDGIENCEPKQTKVKAVLVGDSSILELRCGAGVATVTLEKALLPYLEGLPDQIFDELVLADNTGAVLYQSLKTGNLISNLSVIALRDPDVKPEDPATAPKSPAPLTSTAFSTATQSSTLLPATLGGTKFKLYLSPTSVKVVLDEKPTIGYLVIGGLIREERFRAQSLAVPGSALVTFVLATLVVIIAAWPVTKFAYMRPTERIPRRAAVYFFLSTLGIVILLCVLAIHFRYIFTLKDVDNNLTALASAVEGNFRGEIQKVLQVMDAANRSTLYRSTMAGAAKTKKCVEAEMSTKDFIPPGRVTNVILNQKGLQLSEYPYFERIFFADSRGNQYAKWEVGSVPTSPTSVGDRVYYQETVNGNLWEMENSGASGLRFRVDPVFSKNTGEYRAVISMKPAWLPDSSGKLRPPDVCDTVELSVMSMVAPLLSLSDPVMPPDYGFAITDRNGNVLFHSTAAKSGRENFLNELDDPRDVQVAIVAAQGKYVSTRYQGFPAKVFVTPFLGVQRIPWSLIVFHDLSTGSAENLERIVLFSILALLYYALVSVALFFVPRERVVPKWVWPLEERRGDYLHLIIVLLLIAPAFYALIFRVDSLAAVLLTAILVPLLCLGAGIQKLRSEFVWIMAVSIGSLLLLIPSAALSTANGPSLLLAWIYLWILSLAYPNLYRYLPKKPLPSLRNVFSALCALMLLSVGILPAVAFFRVAYNYHADLSTRRQQIQTVAALAQREARIKSRYRNLEISPGVGAADVNTWLFLRRRLDQTADRYDTVFLSLQRQAFTGFEGGRQQCDEDALPPYLVQLGARIPFGKGSLTRNLSQAPVVRNDVARLSERPPVWRWCREGINRIRLTPNTPDSKTPENSYSLPPTRALLKSVTGDPVFLYPSVVSELPLLKQWSWFWATLVFLPAWLVTFLWVRLTLGHLFLLKNSLAADPFPLMELDKQTPLSESMVLLTFDPARASKILEERGDVHLIEFTECAQGRDIDCSDIRESVIAVKDFDYKRGVETVDIKRLELLERLYVEAPGKPILLLTPVDPALHLAEGLDAATRERCLQLFYGFKRRRLAAVANAEYSTMFFASSIGERVALLQLANEGWLNPRNETALRHLQNRGIVAGTPFGFCDPEFGKYVLNSVAKADRKAWEKHDDAAIWDGIRMTFVVLLCALVAAVLFLNQQTALSYVLTGLGVLAPLTKLLSEARNLPALLGFGGKKE